MRLLFFSNVYPTPAQPTRGSFNRNLLCALSADHEVRSITPVPWTEELSGWLKRHRGIDRDRMGWVDGIRVDYPRFYYPPKILHSHFGTFLWASVKKTISRVIDQFSPDGIIAYWTHPDGEVAVRAAHSVGIPAIVMVGGSDILILTRQGPNRRRAIINVLQRADRVVCVSHHLAEAVERLGICRSKIAVVYRGIDDARFFPSDGNEIRNNHGVSDTDRLLLSVGRLVPVKGFSDLINAYSQVASKRQDFLALIAGSGPLRNELQAQIDQLNLGDRVKLLGNQTADELAVLYRAADLSVLPSHSEGIPNVLLESIASGTPFVATDVGGVHEIADATRDTLVSPGNPAELAEAIEQHLDRWPRRSQLDLPPRSFEPWTWQESAAEMSGVVKDAILASTTASVAAATL